MMWTVFGMLSVLILLSIALDIENSQKYDGEGIGKRTLIFTFLLVLLCVTREFIEAIDPLL